MSRRPVDWSPLAGSDPVPGDADEVERAARSLADMAEEINRQTANAQDWNGIHTMSVSSGVRPLSDREREIVSRVLRAAKMPGFDQLLAQLPSAQVSGGVTTFLDLEVPRTNPPASFTDGPLPARAFVTGECGEVTGEILIWVEQGYLSGLELAWFTEEAPAEWPTPEQVQLEET